MAKKYLLLLLFLMSIVLGGCAFSGTKNTPPSFDGIAEADQYEVKAEIAGKVNNVFVKEGDEIKKGQLLVALDDSLLKNQLEAARANLELARLKYEQVAGKNQNLEEQAKAGIKLAQTQVDLAKIQLEKAKIYSPVSGTVLTTPVKPGEFVNPGTTVATIIDLDKIYVTYYIPEKYLNRIKLGDTVCVKNENLKMAPTGKVVYISPKGEFTPKPAETREDQSEISYLVKIELTKDFQDVRPGMLLTLTLP
ncbi:efflux RND transporter periplasmic adaptor subunit [Carboxydothermus ferrireducens]|uniref:HlyD family secretion protein n=1 Tax=Carboxydothermus ferrireducens DSM 11255 TaxID=1119529 RepID=A0ABX2RAH3_9THEO|nr:efflux RND transporter periplasmic adaptor subunit [Carboxydothermus ferrireducens]NYE56783.1 HlyD family secretion protein [Carboxydothermus ferrireducens DSM 11255]